MNKKFLALWGLKWNPFTPDLPHEALLATPKIESFAWRVENVHLKEGGFALITGDPGTGKSVALRILADRLSRVRDLTVGVLAHPQSGINDFYRELGDLFSVTLKPHNRWGGFKALRERWQEHIESTLSRPILIVDEAQEMVPEVLNELRLLSSTRLDSRIILSVVLAGDGRLLEKLRRDDLLPLGTRLRTRLVLESVTSEELLGCLKHLLSTAGNPALMTAELMNALVDHALGNYRVLTTMGAELLAAAAEREAPQLDEKLYFELYQTPRAPKPMAARAGRRS
jgi:type II secretory pathway predicted ATPase ExeA